MLTEEHVPRVFLNRVLGNIFGLKGGSKRELEEIAW
jgi:hypothetical protein